MSTPTDPAGCVRTFLSRVRPNAKNLPDPVGDDFTSSGRSGEHAPPARILGSLAQLAEGDREIVRAFAWQRGEATQEFISRGLGNSTAYDSKVRELYQKAEADRSALRERWYGGLSMEDKAAFDDLCLTLAASVVQPCFPPSLPAGLRGPMARLALEYAGIVRRADTERNERERSLRNRSLGNRTVVEPILRGLANVEEEATSRLIGRWFRELAPEQTAAFDSSSADPNPGGAGQPEGNKAKSKRGRKPDTDPKADQRVADAWGTGQYRTYEECASALGISKKQVKDAIDRHRHRPAGKRRRQTQALE